jgi:hypothetical protein
VEGMPSDRGAESRVGATRSCFSRHAASTGPSALLLPAPSPQLRALCRIHSKSGMKWEPQENAC